MLELSDQPIQRFLVVMVLSRIHPFDGWEEYVADIATSLGLYPCCLLGSGSVVYSNTAFGNICNNNWLKVADLHPLNLFILVQLVYQRLVGTKWYVGGSQKRIIFVRVITKAGFQPIVTNSWRKGIEWVVAWILLGVSHCQVVKVLQASRPILPRC